MKKKLIRIIIYVLMLIVSVTAAVAADTADFSASLNLPKSEIDIGLLDNVLLEEGFEDGVMPPEGWEVINTNPTKNWEIVHIDSFPEYVHDGNFGARVRKDVVTEQDEWLISPEIQLSGDIINLTFWAYSKNDPPQATVEIHITGTGFDDVVWDMQVNEIWESYEYRPVYIDLTNYNQEVIQIAWRYVGQAGPNFGLDDILVYSGDAPIPPELSIGKITGGWAGLGNGGKISAEIKNIAEAEAEDAKDIEWTISAVGNGLFQMINESDAGIIPVIAPDGLEIIDLIVGQHIGMMNITVTAYEPHFDLFVSKSVKGFIFIGIVLIGSN